MDLRRQVSMGMALTVLPVCLVGCITFTKTSTGDLDFKNRFDKAANDIVARSIQAEKALEGQRVSVDPKVEQFVQRHFVKADELVMANMHAAKRILAAFPFFYEKYAERRTILLNFTLQLQPSLDIVESKFANATAFPSGKVVVSRALAEAFDANNDALDSVLLGILIHELVHVRDGHALEQWATADGRQAWVRDKVIGTVSKVTALIPFLTVKWDMQYETSFGSTKQLPALSEYAADMGAVSLLERAGYDSGRYIAFLSEMSANTPATAPKDFPRLLQQRVECLGIFSKSRFDEELQRIVIGSKEIDGIVYTLDFQQAYRIASLLDSPEILAEEAPIKPGLSHADRRSIWLTETRKSIYMACAIRQSFPDATLKDGVLVTPTFEVMMFTHYFEETLR